MLSFCRKPQQDAFRFGFLKESVRQRNTHETENKHMYREKRADRERASRKAEIKKK